MLSTASLCAHIRSLLMAQEYVVIPGFGGFVSREQEAELLFTEARLLAPSGQLGFNAKLRDEDGLLRRHLATELTCSYEQAGEQLALQVKLWIAELEAQGNLLLPGLGILRTQAHGTWRFEPEIGQNFSPKYYGLPGLDKVQPILRQGQLQTSSKAQVLIAAPERPSRRLRWLSPVAAALVGLVALTWVVRQYLPERQNNASLAQNQSKTEQTLEVQAEPKVQEAGFTLNASPSEPNPQTEPEPEAQPLERISRTELTQPAVNNLADGQLKTYIIVVGAFSKPDNAKRVADGLARKGYLPDMSLMAESKLHRVGVQITCANRNELSTYLQDIRRDFNEKAWILE